jgi:hypothetical protein
MEYIGIAIGIFSAIKLFTPKLLSGRSPLNDQPQDTEPILILNRPKGQLATISSSPRQLSTQLSRQLSTEPPVSSNSLPSIQPPEEPIPDDPVVPSPEVPAITT